MILKVAYRGKDFCGSQIQDKGRTVEGEVISALERLDLIDEDASRFRIISRTDKGVSACCNLAKFESKKNVDIERLNHELPSDIFILGKSEGVLKLPVKKHYVYIVDASVAKKIDTCKLKHVATLFSGRHGFSNFARIEKDNLKTSVRDIDVKVELIGNLVLIHFFGTGFLWQMIRRIVRCMYDFSYGKIDESKVIGLLDCSISKNYSAADADNLILVDIDCGLEFDPEPYIQNKIDKKRGLLEREMFFFSQL
ncbi:MAG: tRNA pseudouridine synthase A [Candidatus Aenigmarchaeota archaeon]|nr:tRNA pseudouridine synthase A [Candidatus Aenigmarchaeota archaeon]